MIWPKGLGGWGRTGRSMPSDGPGQAHARMLIYLQDTRSYLESDSTPLKSCGIIEKIPEGTCPCNNIHMLQIEFGLYRPWRHAFLRCCAPRAQLLSPILRHLRCHMSIGGGPYTYNIDDISTYGSNVWVWGLPSVGAETCRSRPTETVGWCQHAGSPDLKASSPSNRQLEGPEALRSLAGLGDR